MQISSINCQLCSQSFKGLWGGKHVDAAGSDLGNYCDVIYYYHPFFDESYESMNDAIDKKSKYWSAGNEPHSSYYSSSVVVQKHLPFTEEEYNHYKALKWRKLDKIGKTVDEGLLNARLWKYTNNKFKYCAKRLSQIFSKLIKK